jgi:hypothetical protein
LSLSQEIEKPVLQLLPDYPNEYCTYQTAIVHTNSHISFQKHYYSVPYKFIGEKVILKIYADYLEVFDGKLFLCQYSTKHKLSGYYTTEERHLPERSATYGKWNSSRYMQWALRKGPNAVIVVGKMFQQGSEEQYYQRVHPLLKLAGSYSNQRLDNACQLWLSTSPTVQHN